MSQQYQKQKLKWKEQGKEELAIEIRKTIIKRKDKQHIGTLARIYSYCGKFLNLTKCKLSINNKCTGNYSPLKCDGIDKPDDCMVQSEGGEQ